MKQYRRKLLNNSFSFFSDTSQHVRKIRQAGSFRCQKEGFFVDPNSCRGFYRCIPNGPGLTAVRFECGEGTVFDEQISNCNHPWATNRVECGGNQIDAGFGNVQPTPSVSTSIQTSTAPAPTTQSLPQSGLGTICNRDGFLGDPSDCRKFYRCVNDGKGIYTRYDFSCVDGTIWDPSIISCNYPRDVNRTDCSNQNGKYCKVFYCFKSFISYKSFTI